jgi:Arabinose efflux permease
VLNAYTIVFAAVLVPAGRWADRIGRRRLFVAGLALFSVGRAVRAGPGVAALIAARVIQAAGAGAMVPASLSLLLAAVPAPVRPKALGTGPRSAPWGRRSAGDRRRPGAGRLALGVLDQRAGGRGRRVPGGTRGAGEQGPERIGPAGLLGAGLLAAAVGLVALALVKAPEWGWGSARSWACWPPRWCRRGHGVPLAAAPLPVIELELLRSRTFSGSFAASILYYAGFGAFVLSSVEFLTGVWHYSAVEAGLAIAPGR